MSFVKFKYLSKILREIYIRTNTALKGYDIQRWDVSYWEPDYKVAFRAVSDSKYYSIYIDVEIEGTDEKEVARKFVEKLRLDCKEYLVQYENEAKENLTLMENDYREAKQDESHYIVTSLQLFLETLDSISLKK